MSMGLNKTSPASITGVSKKHTRSRGRAKKPEDPYASAYGIVPYKEFRGRPWTKAHVLGESAVGKRVLVFGTVQYIHPLSKTRVVVVLLNYSSTVRCVIDAGAGADEGVTKRMMRFAITLRRETPIDVEGVVALPCSQSSIIPTTQKVDIQVTKLHSIGYETIPSQNGKFPSSSTVATPRPPNALGGEAEFGRSGQAGRDFAHIDQDPSLNHVSACLNLPSLVDHAVFRVQPEVEFKIMGLLRSNRFVGIHTQSMFSGSTEADSTMVNPEGFSVQPACLAQSPLLYMQMATSEIKRVFEIGPVFRLEKSNCELHRCNFIDLGAEMEIKEHYFEVYDIINALVVELFNHLNENCKKELETINQQCRPFEPLKYLERTLMLKYEEGVQMLKEAGIEVKPMCDLTTDHEKKLSRLVREKYNTDLFILYQHPLAVRPLYTMPCVENRAYGNSFDFFIRGVQVICGSQRIHKREVLMERAAEFGIDTNHIMNYSDLFRYGLPPHVGFHACLYRMVMLFCGLDHC